MTRGKDAEEDAAGITTSWDAIQQTNGGCYMWRRAGGQDVKACGRLRCGGVQAAKMWRRALKLSVGSGVEEMVSNPARPIRTLHFQDPTDRLTEGPTGFRSLSK